MSGIDTCRAGVYSARFFEVWLNSCEAPALAATVEARAGDLRTLPSLRWWRHSDYEGGVDDLRDAFARLSPLRPLDENALTSVRSWMSGAGGLSEFGRQRWACLDALSAFHRSGLDAEACWQVVEGWTRGLSLEVLTMDERYVFLAWVIRRTELAESQIARLASWLTRQHLNDPDRGASGRRNSGRFLDVEPELISRRQRFVSDLRGVEKCGARRARSCLKKPGAGVCPRWARSVKIKDVFGFGPPVGRRRASVEIAVMAIQGDGPPVLGIDLGGTKILAGVVSANNEILGKAKRATPAMEGGDAILRAIVDCIDDALTSARLSRHDIAAAGVGSPGPLDSDAGVILFSSNMNVRNFALGPSLASVIGRPVLVENDVRVGGYGEFRLGAGRGYQNLIAVFVGTGIGGCLIQSGRVVAGATGNAGEVGHIPIKAGGPKCGCGSRGCMEALASRTAIARRIGKAVRKGVPTMLGEKVMRKTGRLKSGEIADAVAAGDHVTVREVRRAAHFLGLGLGGLINVLGPEIVIIGGGVAEALGEPWVDLVRTSAREQAIADSTAKVKIERAATWRQCGHARRGAAARANVTLPRRARPEPPRYFAAGKTG